MLSIDDIKIGTRVRCLFYGNNPIGTITKLSAYSGWFYVTFDDSTHPDIPWSKLSSFELLSEIKEKQCHQCGKPNDIGISVCWNCAILDP